ncbi:hypothetical protein EVAR_66341_1 [Eumeta japonica]|uniref:Uncharacterized protein n=1 Tax=Eumeta variegata TaxID=151549 RepID=A0A4C2A6Z1_EUMVA|nr:hypothetical protein EVAR_66341_1 [Eumeta japonica]
MTIKLDAERGTKRRDNHSETRFRTLCIYRCWKETLGDMRVELTGHLLLDFAVNYLYKEKSKYMNALYLGGRIKPSALDVVSSLTAVVAPPEMHWASVDGLSG